MRRPAPWARRVAARGRSTVREGLGPGLLAAGLEQRLVGAGERQLVDGHQGQRAAGDVDALPEAQGGEQAGGLVVGEGLGERGLGQVALGQDRRVQRRPERVGRGLHGPVAGEQGQGPAAGGGDQGLRAPRAVPPRSPACGGRAGGRRSRGGRWQRSRRGCRRPARRPARGRGRRCRPGGAGWWPLVSTAVRCSQTNSVKTGATSRGATQSLGSRPGCSTHATTSGVRFMVTSTSACSVVTAFMARSWRVVTSAASESILRRAETASSSRVRAAASTAAEVVAQPSPQTGVDERRQRQAQTVAGAEQAVLQRLVLDDPADDMGQGGEPAGRQLGPARLRDGVLELVGLVEDDQLVVGQHGATRGEVGAVEVGVDHDHVGRGRGVAGVLGEAVLAPGALGRRRGTRRSPMLTAAQVAARGSSAELGPVAGRRRLGPLGQLLDVRRRRLVRRIQAGAERELDLAVHGLVQPLTAQVVGPPLEDGEGEGSVEMLLRGTAGPCPPAGPAGPWWPWPRPSARPDRMAGTR